ncbi:MmcQ/YjbR family DNA-binding protein [Photobacterium sp. TY1-4]|uniref:MmcQ/YjbR family DNA-binding protein n=1 Tax=Photobacterium sp. TY1-4 TaxID=2899122 RepID=UPI0021C06866|nr:MmcQ/YjbR family DNA-binding protein [Photobacterium sp. TY1-4]UXI04264.1 MmcQ/YjbR family DNA-binding protein [Photobacterium sp. TY1-4]
MNVDEFNHFCGSFPATTHVVQWGNSQVWKVGGKVFAIGSRGKQEQPAFTFKTSDLNFVFLSNHDGYIPAPYFATRGMKWIQQTETSGELDEALRYYLSESYRIVALGLSKRQQQALGINLHPAL